MAVNGIDVSKWQGRIDWGRAKAAGANFAIIRAGSVDNSSGQCYTDTQLERNKIEAIKFMPVGYYWYFRPNQNPINQADYFARLLNSMSWNIYPAIDAEEYGGMSPESVMSAAWVMADRLVKSLAMDGRPGPRVLTDMIYTSPGFWNSRVKRNTWAGKLPLYVAHWGVAKPLLPADWVSAGATWKFWQTHVGVDGPSFGMESEGLDHDLYNGTWEQFEAEFGLGEPAPVEEISGMLNILGKTYAITGKEIMNG